MQLIIKITIKITKYSNSKKKKRNLLKQKVFKNIYKMPKMLSLIFKIYFLFYELKKYKI